MKLAINAISLAPGGGLAVLGGFLEAWRDIDAPLEITAYASRPAVLETIQSIRPDVKTVPFGDGLPLWRRHLHTTRRLGPTIEQSRADVVWTVDHLVPRCSTPQLVHYQNLYWFLHRHPWRTWLGKGRIDAAFKDALARRSLRLSDCRAYISRYLRQEAERIVPESAPGNHVLYNGLSKATLAAAEVEQGGWRGAPHLAAIQSTQVHKDNRTLLRTLARLVELAPTVPWRLSIAGSGDWAPIREFAASLGVAERVEFLGFLNTQQMDVVLRRALCMVFPSCLEAFGLPLIEAMARRCPPVACNRTAVPEIVGDAGLLAEPGDETQFADAVLRIYREPELRRDLVERGLQNIRRFRWTDSAAKMLTLFASIAR